MGESAEDYRRIEKQISQAVKPEDVFEHIWVRDITDLVWDVIRHRRMKFHLLQNGMPNAIRKILTNISGPSDDSAFITGWMAGNEDSRKGLERILNKNGLTMDSVLAEALTIKLPDIERIDRLIASAEARRNMVLREISRHRDALASALARVSARIEDAEFAEVEPIIQPKQVRSGEPT